MDKFAHEKNRKRDIIIARGADPISIGIRRNDEYLSENELGFLHEKALHADKAHSSAKAPERKPINVVDDDDGGRDLLVGVSQDMKNMFSNLLLSHPDTRFDEYGLTKDGDIEVETTRTHPVFIRELVRAIVAFDEARKKFKK